MSTGSVSDARGAETRTSLSGSKRYIYIKKIRLWWPGRTECGLTWVYTYRVCWRRQAPSKEHEASFQIFKVLGWDLGTGLEAWLHWRTSIKLWEDFFLSFLFSLFFFFPFLFLTFLFQFFFLNIGAEFDLPLNSLWFKAKSHKEVTC